MDPRVLAQLSAVSGWLVHKIRNLYLTTILDSYKYLPAAAARVTMHFMITP